MMAVLSIAVANFVGICAMHSKPHTHYNGPAQKRVSGR